MNNRHMKIISDIQQLMGVCCVVGIPLTLALSRCIKGSFLQTLGETSHLFENQDVMDTLFHCVTSGRVTSDDILEDVTDEFKKLGLQRLADEMKKFQCFDLFSDPGMLHHNRLFFKDNLELWLQRTISYDSEDHKGIDELMKECGLSDEKVTQQHHCVGCGLYREIQIQSPMRFKRLRSALSSVPQTCSNCDWYMKMNNKTL